MKTFQEIISDYHNYDGDHNKTVELNMEWPSFEDPSEPVDASKKLVVVVVNKNIFNDINPCTYTKVDIVYRLARFKYDLLREGRQAKFVAVTPFNDPSNLSPADGKSVLALRDFFVVVRSSFPNFEGAIIVGTFPDARTIHLNIEDHSQENPAYFNEAGFLYGGAPVDLVLADLDGNWSNLYLTEKTIQQHKFSITANTKVTRNGTKVHLDNPSIQIVGPVGNGQRTMHAAFFIQDAVYSIAYGTPTQVDLDLAGANPEVGGHDKNKPNPISTPKICLSRINARHVAVQPNPRLLDAKGKPKQVAYDPAICPNNMDNWSFDPDLERRLLVDYFDRNHAFRYGRFSNQPVSITLIESMGLGDAQGLEGIKGFGSPANEVKDATLLDFVRWMKSSNTFRVISTHADVHATALRPDDSQAESVARETGGNPWCWINEGGKLKPSFKGHPNADLYVYRTLWENGQYAGVTPSLMIHVGCSVNGNDNSDENPYDSRNYARFHNAESILFYGNQLAVLSRLSWWNHGPEGFGTGFGSSDTATFGDGYRVFCEKRAQDGSLKSQPTENKRSYDWGIVGDWTLMKHYKAPSTGANLAIAGLKAPAKVQYGAAFKVEVSVTNRGTEAAGPSMVAIAFIRLSVTGLGGETIFRSVPPLAAGQVQTLSFLHAIPGTKPFMASKYLVTAAADALKDVPESNEFDNSFSITVSVARSFPSH